MRILTRILKCDVVWVKQAPAVFDIICELGSDVMNTCFDARNLYFSRQFGFCFLSFRTKRNHDIQSVRGTKFKNDDGDDDDDDDESDDQLRPSLLLHCY